MKDRTSRAQVAYLHLGTVHAEFPNVVRALASRGITATLLHLDDAELVDWTAMDLINVRMCRNFHLRPDFASRIHGIAENLADAGHDPGRMLNATGLVPDAYDKSRYLPRLAAAGIRTIPTCWFTRDAPVRLTDVMAEKGWNDVVVKPAVSSRSWSTFRAQSGSTSGRRGTDHLIIGSGDDVDERFVAELAHTTVGVQPFLPAVLSEGEMSMVFLGGEFSHAVRKTVAVDGWFAHELLGGLTKAETPPPELVTWASAVHAALVEMYGELTFARVDALTDADGQPTVLECELVIPRLFLVEGEAFDRYAEVIEAAVARVAAGAEVAR